MAARSGGRESATRRWRRSQMPYCSSSLARYTGHRGQIGGERVLEESLDVRVLRQ